MFVYGAFDRRRRTAPAGRDNVTGYASSTPRRDQDGDAAARDVVHQRRPGEPNLDLEIPRQEPSTTVRDAAAAAVERPARPGRGRGANDDQLATLYSNLYRLNLYPNSQSRTPAPPRRRAAVREPGLAADRRADTPTQTGAKIVDGKIYVNNGFWDTYRTAWPAYSLLYPDVAGRDRRRVRPAVPRRRLDRPLVVARLRRPDDRHQLGRGVRRRVPQGRQAVDASSRRTTRPSRTRPSRPPAQRGRPQGHRDLAVPRLHADHHRRRRCLVGAGGLHQRLRHRQHGRGARQGPGHAEVRARAATRRSREYFLERARNYVNLFDPKARLLPGPRRRRQLAVLDGYDPLDWGGDYTETNGWNFAFTARRTARAWPTCTAAQKGAAGQARRVLRHPGDRRRDPGGVRRRHPRDDRGARRPDGPARA